MAQVEAQVDMAAISGRPAVTDRDIRRALRRARRHSRFVRLMRYVLPVAAALVVTGVFLPMIVVPRLPLGIDLSGVSIDGREVTMTKPHLTGRGNNGQSYEVRAERAVQDVAENRVLELFDVAGRIVEASGRETKLSAEFGRYDNETKMLRLERRIVLEMDGGYKAHLETADIDVDGGHVTTGDPVRVELTNMVLNANTMSIADTGRHLVFDGRVSMTIDLSGSMPGIPSIAEIGRR